MKRQLIEVRVSSNSDLNSKKINGLNIERVWTIYDAQLLEQIKKNPEKLNELNLEENKGLFFEHKKSDWNVDEDNLFWYYTRLASRNDRMNVILEINE